MIPFPSPLHFDNAGMRGGKRCIVVTQEFVAITSLGSIRVPAGFVSDGGSIPRAAWSLTGCPFSEYLEECVVHDWLYSRKSSEDYTRAEADFILRELMWNCEVARWKIAAFYAALKCFGWANYKRQ